MALFSKNKTASDILKMIADLPEEERASLMAMLNDKGEEEAPEAEAETVQTEEAETEPEAEAEETDATEEAQPEEVEEVPTEETETEETVAEAPVEEDPSAEVAQAEAEEDNARDTDAEIAKLSEALAALAQRLDAIDAKLAGGSSEGEDIGMPFGPDITDAKNNDQDELEAARKAAFGF